MRLGLHDSKTALLLCLAQTVSAYKPRQLPRDRCVDDLGLRTWYAVIARPATDRNVRALDSRIIRIQLGQENLLRKIDLNAPLLPAASRPLHLRLTSLHFTSKDYSSGLNPNCSLKAGGSVIFGFLLTILLRATTAQSSRAFVLSKVIATELQIFFRAVSWVKVLTLCRSSNGSSSSGVVGGCGVPGLEIFAIFRHHRHNGIVVRLRVEWIRSP